MCNEIKNKTQGSTNMSEEIVTTEEEQIQHHSTIVDIHLDDGYYSDQPQALEDCLQTLNGLLDTVGVKLTADSHSLLSVSIDEEKLYSVTVRRAGRKKKKTDARLDEIMQYRETHTAMETAEWLGLTRQTFYRKMKEHMDAGDEGSVEF